MTLHEREHEAREELLRVFNMLYPGIAGNPFIPHWPTSPQLRFLGLHLTDNRVRDGVFQALYGGAAGGGKSDALLMAAAQFVDRPEFTGICFRRTHTELALPGALMDRALSWWRPAGAAWDGTNKIFRFPSGARVAMAYLSSPDDHYRYQSAEFHFSGWDELTHWPTPLPYKYVGLSRVRRASGSGIPLRTLAATNPGGPGHSWVRDMFVGGGVDAATGEPITPQHPYVPARIDDNPYLDRDSYVMALAHLHPTLRDQLLKGDWTAREPGDYYRTIWFGPLLEEADRWPASDCVRVRWWDLAASEREGAARTAGVLMARHAAGVRAVEHAVAFRATPGARDARIVQQAQLDGRSVVVGIEIEPGSGGIAQFDALELRLRKAGFRVAGARPRVDQTDDRELRLLLRNPVGGRGKLGRADPVAACLQRGFHRRGEGGDQWERDLPWWGEDLGRPVTQQRDGIRLFAFPGVQAMLDELEGFPDEAAQLDFSDAMAGAYAYLEAHPAGATVPLPPSDRAAVAGAPRPNEHPEDRPEAAASGQDRAGRWTP